VGISVCDDGIMQMPADKQSEQKHSKKPVGDGHTLSIRVIPTCKLG